MGLKAEIKKWFSTDKEKIMTEHYTKKAEDSEYIYEEISLNNTQDVIRELAKIQCTACDNCIGIAPSYIACIYRDAKCAGRKVLSLGWEKDKIPY